MGAAAGDVDFCHLVRTVEQQQGAISALRKDLAQVREEVDTLRECLLADGVLDRVRFLIHLHRRLFATACAQHPLTLELRFEGVIEVRTIALAVGMFAGPTTMRSLREASKSLAPAAKDVLGTLGPGHVYVCGGFEGALALSSVERLDPTVGIWEALPPMQEARQYTCAGVVNGRLYVCGGWGGPQPVRSVERLDPLNGLWETMPPMLVARWGASAGVIGGRLHICGGLDDNRQPLGSVERFDPVAAEAAMALDPLGIENNGADSPLGPAWEAIASMAERRGWPAAGVLGGSLYVCGGRDEQREPLSSVERLGPGQITWEPLKPMAGQRAGAAAAAAAGRLYVCGGAFGAQMLSSAERYDPRVGFWETLPSMAARRAYVAAAAVAGRLHVFGGSDGGQCLGTTEQFDPIAGTWSVLPALSERRSGAAAVALLS